MKQQFAAKHPWTILAAGAAIQVLTGLPAAWGVFQQPVMEEYGLSEQGAGYAFALLIAAFGVGCVLGGFLQDKKGPRCAALWGTALLCGGFFAAAFLPGWAGWGFFLAFSIPAGLGTAFLSPSIQSCAQKWYAGRKGLATFGGLVIYCGLKYVPIVLCAGWAVMWIFDCTVMFPITVGIALPLLMYLFGEAPAKIITAICAGAVLDVMHIGNMKKALAGDEIMHVRDYFREKLHKER